jgi:hypothetical protein
MSWTFLKPLLRKGLTYLICNRIRNVNRDSLMPDKGLLFLLFVILEEFYLLISCYSWVLNPVQTNTQVNWRIQGNAHLRAWYLFLLCTRDGASWASMRWQVQPLCPRLSWGPRYLLLHLAAWRDYPHVAQSYSPWHRPSDWSWWHLWRHHQLTTLRLLRLL